MPELVIRPLEEGDVAAAADAAYTSLHELGRSIGLDYGPPPEQREPGHVERGRYRVDHIRRHDGPGSWVAMQGERCVGVSLAIKREGTWFLSLLAVATDLQSAGIGRRLLDASLTYADPAAPAWILSSHDAKAIRRYHQAGFTPLPTYDARGPVDRSLLPADLRVRHGELPRDAEQVDAIARSVRGAGYGPDLEAYCRRGTLWLTDEGDGYLVAGALGPIVLGAQSPEAAQRLLWTALAEATADAAEVMFLTGAQQWAIDVAMEARLSLGWGGSVCVRDVRAPLVPYVPSGAYG